VIQRPFGPLERSVPIIGQGTWNVPVRGARADEAKHALRRGVELGMTHIDTAEMYGDGASERLIGAAIADLPREELFLVSKVLPSNATFAGTIRACEASLGRLRTDYLDCYLLHWRGSVPLRETMRAMEQLVRDGKIRSLGVSNFDVSDMQEAAAALEREPLACNQVLYHLGERSVETHEIPYARASDRDRRVHALRARRLGRRSRTTDARDGREETRRDGTAGGARVLDARTDRVRDPEGVDARARRGERRCGRPAARRRGCAAIDAAFPVARRRGGIPTL
jgi:aryl-alcohol dehydrogenase-like predicted oxidoreductase